MKVESLLLLGVDNHFAILEQIEQAPPDDIFLYYVGHSKWSDRLLRHEPTYRNFPPVRRKSDVLQIIEFCIEQGIKTILPLDSEDIGTLSKYNALFSQADIILVSSLRNVSTHQSITTTSGANTQKGWISLYLNAYSQIRQSFSVLAHSEIEGQVVEWRTFRDENLLAQCSDWMQEAELVGPVLIVFIYDVDSKSYVVESIQPYLAELTHVAYICGIDIMQPIWHAVHRKEYLDDEHYDENLIIQLKEDYELF